MKELQDYIFQNLKKAKFFEICEELGRTKKSIRDLDCALHSLTESEASKILEALKNKKFAYIQNEDDICYEISVK